MEPQQKRCVICLNLQNCRDSKVKAYKLNRSKGGIPVDDEKIISCNIQIKDDCKTLKDQLPVIFLLRKLLEIPLDVCIQFLQDYGNPCSWVNYCDSCSVLVDNARQVFDQMTLLQKQFKNLQAELKNTVFVSINSPETAFCDDLDEGSEIVRLYVNNCYQNFEVATAPDSLSSELFKSDTLTRDRDKDAASKDVNNSTDEIHFLGTEFVDVGKDVENPQFEENFNSLFETTEIQNRSSGKRNRKQTFSPSNARKYKDKNLSESELSSCYECGEKYLTADDLMEHVKTHMGDKRIMCQYCGKSFASPISLVLHLRRHPGKEPFKCEYCSKNFLTPGLLSTHVKSHLGEYSCKCHRCKKRFKTCSELKIHSDECHNSGNKFSCRKYGYDFANAEDLEGHMAVHSDKTCKSCGKTFTRKFGLKKHETSGSCLKVLLDKPYKCERCGNGYADFSSLRNHKRNPCTVVQPKIGCKSCGKTFTRRFGLKKHEASGICRKVLLDKPYKCERCGNGYADIGNLNRHKRNPCTLVHPNECKFCGKEVKRGELTKHIIMAHSGEPGVNPTKCKFCAQEFLYRQTLLRHVKTRHKESEFENTESFFIQIPNNLNDNDVNEVEETFILQ